jgi:hypothetical protein
MAIYNHLLFSEIFFQQVRTETADLDNLRATLSTIRGTWQYYLPPPPDWDGIGWAPSCPFSPDDVAQLRANIVEQIFAYLELTYGPCEADERAFFLYADWTQEDRTGLCLVLPFSANIEGRDPETGIIPKGRNYAQQLMRLLREHDLDWGVLTNGRHWRLFHRTELSPTETYLHVDLERIIAADDIGDYIVFHRFFSRPAFARQDSRQRLDLYKQQSDEATEVIEDHLSAHVEEIARQLCQGLVESCRTKGDDVTTPQVRTEIYKNALFLVYRLLFVLYAEARDLLPLDVPTYRDVCLRDLLAEAQQNHERGMRYDDEYAMWTRLQALFALIDQGDPAAGVPAYNGGLFDPGRRPFLAVHRIRNDYLQAALIRLSTMPARGKSYDQDRKPQPIDYRDLSVRHLGSLYEGLLEYNLFVVEDESRVVRVTKKKTQYVPYSEAGKVRAGETVLQVGDVYFSETAGERKATGSYYTPEDVVDYIVRNTVGAKLAELKAEFYEAQGIERQLADLNDTPPDIPAHRQIQQALDAQFLDFVRQKVLDLKILDPAMGSGHFLVNATHAVADFVVEVLNETPWENGEFDTNVATWKRQVAERCIFGVDLNELAVELAKLCLWMTTAAKGKPLTFLDHHLRWGNSLVGAWLKDVGIYPGVRKESQQAFTLPLERFQVELGQVLAAYQELYAKSGDDVDDVREKARIFDEEIYPVLEHYRELLDLHTGVYLGNGLDEAAYAQLGAVVSDSAAWTRLKAEQLDVFLTQHTDQCFFHWELEFHEVFSAPRKGFDAIVGNPPYIEVSSLLYRPLSSATPKCGNTYAAFLEVAVETLAYGGKYGLVVPISVVSTERMAPVQELLLSNSSVVKVANFAVRPATLFQDVDMNISIVTGTRSAKSSTTRSCQCLTTGYTRWYPDERPYLFDRLAFVDSTEFVTPGRIPKLGLPIERSILQKLKNDNAMLSDFIDLEDGEVLYYHSGGRYWRKAILEDLSSEYKSLHVMPKYFDAILALLNSNLFYWYWIVFSDCYHVVRTDVYNFPIDCSTFSHSQLTKLKWLSQNLLQDYESNATTIMRRLGGAKKAQKQFFPVKSKPIIDEIDRVLADHYGLAATELDFVLSFDGRFRGL